MPYYYTLLRLSLSTQIFPAIHHLWKHPLFCHATYQYAIIYGEMNFAP